MTDVALMAAKLAQIIRLLASDKPGETVAAIEGMRRVLDSQGATFHDLAGMIERGAGVSPGSVGHNAPVFAPVPPWANMTEDERRKWLDVLFDHIRFFNEWQIRHLADVSRLHRCGTRINDRKTEVIDRMLLRFWEQRALA